jgi:hypothetical protein
MTDKTIWAVVHGDYSSYGVDGIYEDRGTAEIVAAQLNLSRDDYCVEEFPFYAAGDISLRPRPQIQASVTVSRHGVIGEDVETRSHDLVSDHDAPAQGAWVGHYRDGAYRAYALATTAEAAIKAVRERAAEVAQAIVEGRNPLTIENARRAALNPQVDSTP